MSVEMCATCHQCRYTYGFALPCDVPLSLPPPPSDDVEAGGPGAGATAESRAARAYEARINPFAEFQQTEQEMRVRNMQVGGGMAAPA